MTRTGHFVETSARERYRRVHEAALAAMPAHTAHDVETPYGSVRVLWCRSGAGAGRAPLVLLPGTGASGVSWAGLVPALTADRDVLLVDLLGGPGGSRQEVPLRRVGDQVRWLHAMVTELELPGIHLAGVSMGARLALGLAIHGHPRLRSLTAIEPIQSLVRLPARMYLVGFGSFPGAPDALRRRFCVALGVDPDRCADDPVAALFDTWCRSYAAAVPMPAVCTDSELAAVTVPTSVLLGGRSEVVDTDRARRRAETRMRDVRVEVWPSASHGIVTEWPGAVAASLLAHAAASETVRSS